MAWDFQQFGMCDQQRLRPACAYAQSDQSLCQSLEYSMIVKLLTEHHLEFLSLIGGCGGSSKSTLVKMSNCWKSHAVAHLKLQFDIFYRETLLTETGFLPFNSAHNLFIYFFLSFIRKWNSTSHVHYFSIYTDTQRNATVILCHVLHVAHTVKMTRILSQASGLF